MPKGKTQAPAAKLAEQITVEQIEAARAVATDATLIAVLDTALADARGALALVQAENERLAEWDTRKLQANAIAVEHKLADTVLASMLAAIDADYVQVEQSQAPEAEPEVQAPATKQVGARMQAINAAVAADPLALARGQALLGAFDSGDAAEVMGVSRDAGTRYPSLVALARNGAGVSSRADYVTAVAAVRLYMRSIGYAGKGNGAADNNWLLQKGPHAAGAGKSADCLTFKFRNRMRLALCADGQFRLAVAGTPDVRFVDSNAEAWAKWSGSHSAPASAAPAAPAQPEAQKAPTPPNLQAGANGALTAVASCQHCSTRNIVTYDACRTCGQTDWNAS